MHDGRQTTIAHSAATDGIGLHTGRVTRVELSRPNRRGHRFRRTDLPGRPRIQARPEAVNAAMLARRTELVAAGRARRP